MLTRHKRQLIQKEKQKQDVIHFCTPFSINPTILPSTKTIQRQNNKHLNSFERTTRKHINKTIQQQIKLTHPYGDVDVVLTAIPYFYFKRIIQHWEEYIPQRKKPGCIDYYQTYNESCFRKSFPKLHLTKKVSQVLKMKLTVGRNAPVRIIYHRKQRMMYLCFWYEPYPYPELWYPTYRNRTRTLANSLGKQCWKMKKKKTRRKVVMTRTESAD